jgi:hypothetical protein
LRRRAAAGEAGRVPVLPLWDESPPPPWSQLRRRLRDDPGVRSLLLAELGRHPATAGRLAGLQPYRTEPPSHSTWFAGTWMRDGIDVLVKINITGRERFWMAAASAATTGLVPRVLASDSGLGDLDVAWLVLERLPYRFDPAWGAPGFSALLAAAARFQAFAACVDTPLVYEEDIGTIRHWALGGRDLCPAWYTRWPRSGPRRADRRAGLMRSAGWPPCTAAGWPCCRGVSGRRAGRTSPGGRAWRRTCAPQPGSAGRRGFAPPPPSRITIFIRWR